MRWFKDDSLIQYNSVDVLVNKPGVYHLEYTTSDNCELVSKPIELMAGSISNSLSPGIDSLGICENGGFHMLQVVSSPDYKYYWYYNDELIPGEELNFFKAEKIGEYYASITNGGCVTSTPTRYVYEANDEFPTATLSGDTIVGLGGSATLYINFTSSPPFNYSFTNGETGVSNFLNIAHLVEADETTTYELGSVVNTCGEGNVFGSAKIQVLILGDEPELGNDILVYPNPILTSCKLLFDFHDTHNVSYSLIDMNGRVHEMQNLGAVKDSEIELKLNSLLSGEYFLVFKVDDEKIVRKIIKI